MKAATAITVVLLSLCAEVRVHACTVPDSLVTSLYARTPVQMQIPVQRPLPPPIQAPQIPRQPVSVPHMPTQIPVQQPLRTPIQVPMQRPVDIPAQRPLPTAVPGNIQTPPSQSTNPGTSTPNTENTSSAPPPPDHAEEHPHGDSHDSSQGQPADTTLDSLTNVHANNSGVSLTTIGLVGIAAILAISVIVIRQRRKA